MQTFSLNEISKEAAFKPSGFSEIRELFETRKAAHLSSGEIRQFLRDNYDFSEGKASGAIKRACDKGLLRSAGNAEYIYNPFYPESDRTESAVRQDADNDSFVENTRQLICKIINETEARYDTVSKFEKSNDFNVLCCRLSEKGIIDGSVLKSTLSDMTEISYVLRSLSDYVKNFNVEVCDGSADYVQTIPESRKTVIDYNAFLNDIIDHLASIKEVDRMIVAGCVMDIETSVRNSMTIFDLIDADVNYYWLCGIFNALGKVLMTAMNE